MGPLCVRSHKKFVVTIACAVAGGAFVAGAVASLMMLPAATVVVNDDVPVHVVEVPIGRSERGGAQSKGDCGYARLVGAPIVIVHAIMYDEGIIIGALPVLVNL
jgi:hypothetical protein